MKRAAGKMIGLLTGMSMTALISAGCGAESTEMVTVTLGNCETQICNMRAVIHNQWR